MSVASFAPLDPAVYREVVRRALAEDVRWGDITTEAVVSTDLAGVGRLRVETPCVLAGLDVATECFAQLDPHVRVERHKRDGERCAAGDLVAEVRGFAAALLTAERTALNFLRRLCGVATLTRTYVDGGGGRITVIDTRSTTPTLRALEAYAVRVGGGVNHRVGLDDGVRIKTNHIQLVGSLAEAVRRVREAGTELPIEVEARSLEAVDEALEAGADTIIVDKLSIAEIRDAVTRSRGLARIEVAGPVAGTSVAELADTGAEYLSVTALTGCGEPIDLRFETTGV